MRNTICRFTTCVAMMALSLLPLVSSPRNVFAERRAVRTGSEAKDADNSDYKPLSELGQVVGGVQFKLVRRGRHRVDIVVRGKGFTLTMPDQTVSRGEKGDQETFYPGESDKGYYYYLSPDHNWLFVERGLYHRYAVGYLYHRVSPTRMVAVLPGDNFYDAALRYYCAVRHVNFAKLISKERNLAFTRWDLAHHRVYFWEWAQSNWDDRLHKDDINAEVDMAFDLQTKKFTVIKVGKRE